MNRVGGCCFGFDIILFSANLNQVNNDNSRVSPWMWLCLVYMVWSKSFLVVTTHCHWLFLDPTLSQYLTGTVLYVVLPQHATSSHLSITLRHWVFLGPCIGSGSRKLLNRPFGQNRPKKHNVEACSVSYLDLWGSRRSACKISQKMVENSLELQLSSAANSSSHTTLSQQNTP